MKFWYVLDVADVFPLRNFFGHPAPQKAPILGSENGPQKPILAHFWVFGPYVPFGWKKNQKQNGFF